MADRFIELFVGWTALLLCFGLLVGIVAALWNIVRAEIADASGVPASVKESGK